MEGSKTRIAIITTMRVVGAILVCLGLSTIFGDSIRSARVIRVIDGDTIVCVGTDGIDFKVRLIGVNTPELHRYARREIHPEIDAEYYATEAKQYTEFLVDKKWVRLEFEDNRIDIFGRTLAYVYVDDILVNEKIIEQGYGFTYGKYSFAKLPAFDKKECEAREHYRGLWARLLLKE